LRSPLCDPVRRLALPAAQQRSCARTGSPLSGVPTGNYAFDINWDPPITHPADVAVKALYSLLNMLWLALLFCLRGVLTLLDWAFSLNPFELLRPGGGSSMSGLQRALGRLFSVIDAGFLTAVIAGVGLWGLWTGIVRRRTAQTLGGLALSVLMLAGAIAVVLAPDKTAGMAARLSDQTAMGLLAAPSQGLNAPPTASYADAMHGLFDDVVRAPWCALDFKTQRFCTEPIDRGAQREALVARDGNKGQVAPLTRVPRSELWLSFAPDSAPRKALYVHYGGKDAGKIGVLGLNVLNTGIGDRTGTNPDEVAIQGSSGGLTRLPLLLLIAVGVLGALLVLVWIVLRLLAQATLGFVLLLLTPIALLFVGLGEAGRTAFTRWALALLGAIVSKVIYAALLGVVVLAAHLLAQSADAGNWMLAWLLQAGFWWSVYLKRTELIGLLSAVPAFDHQRPGRHLATMFAARGAARTAVRAATTGRDAAKGHKLRERTARSDAVRAGAREHLESRAEHRAGQHHADAAAVLERDQTLRDALDTLTANPDRGGDPRSDPPPPTNTSRAGPAVEAEPDRHAALVAERSALAPRVEAARATLATSAVPRPAAGQRRDEGPGLEQLRRELALPAHDARHAWRVGLSPDALLDLRERDSGTHATHLRTIGAQLDADRRVLRALPSDPRTPPAPSIERQAARDLDPRRLAELQTERRDRLRHDRARRRYLYR
jgi:hypothetical protein